MSYHNITISGLPGCGSTTLLKLLKAELEPQGWRGFSGGDFMRQYAISKGLFDPVKDNFHHDATVYNEDFDRQVDFGMREKLSTEKHWILESWLSGFMAQQVPGTLKILLTCSDDAVRIDRIVNRDEVTVDQAKDHIRVRREKNEAKWRRMYADQWQTWVVQPGTQPPDAEIDFWQPALYDKIIDTYSHSREDTLQEVLAVI